MRTIRKATASDAAQVSALIYSHMHLFLVEPDGKGAEHFLEMSKPAGLALLFSNPNIRYLIGEENGIFCGAVALRNNSHLQHLYIASSFQRRGIGTYLWKTACEQALPAGNAEQFTVNAVLSAIPFYQRMGFEIIGDVSKAGGLRCQPMKLKLDI